MTRRRTKQPWRIVKCFWRVLFSIRYFLGFSQYLFGNSVRLIIRSFRHFVRTLPDNKWAIVQSLPAVVAGLVAIGFVLCGHSRSAADVERWYRSEGLRALTADNLDAAQLYLHRVADVNEFNVESQIGLAAIALRREDTDRARRLLQRIASPNRQGHAAAHLWLARDMAERTTSKTPEEIGLIEKHLLHVVSQWPDSVDAIVMLTQLYLHQARPMDAVRYLEPAYQKHPSLALILGRAYLSIDQKEKAARALKSAQSAYRELSINNPDDVQSRSLWAECQMLLRDYAGARTTLMSGLFRSGNAQYKPAIVQVMVAESDSLRQGGDTDWLRSMELLESAMQLAPGNPYVLNRWAAIAKTPGPDRERVRKLLGDLLVQGKASAGVHLVLGAIAAYDEDHETAQQQFKLGLLQQPKMAHLLNNYAWTLARSDPPEFTKALEYATQAVQNLPDAPEIWETRGQILAKLERWEECIADLEKALPAMPDRREVRDTLILAYDALGRHEIAEKHRDNLVNARPE